MSSSHEELAEEILRLREDNRHLMDALDSKPNADAVPFSESGTFRLGVLSRIIAHDIKNIITTIQGNAEMAQSTECAPSSMLESYLGNILLATRECRDLCNRVLHLGRNRTEARVPVDLRLVVEQVFKVLEPLRQNIECSSHFPPQPVFILADRSEIYQLIFNLTLNSLQAMGKDKGHLIISVELMPMDKVRLCVQDTGKGMSQDFIRDMFDPLNVSHYTGVGHGLGLAIIRQIVNAHQGLIQVQSELGRGTRFIITLSRTDQKPESLPAPRSSPASLSPKVKRKILYVEDDESVREMGMTMLQTLNLRVSVAVNGREALEVIKRNPDYFDMVLTDSRMPEMTGIELARAIRGQNLKMPVILVTAVSDPGSQKLAFDNGVTEILSKPFMMDELQRLIDKVLREYKPAKS